MPRSKGLILIETLVIPFLLLATAGLLFLAQRGREITHHCDQTVRQVSQFQHEGNNFCMEIAEQVATTAQPYELKFTIIDDEKGMQKDFVRFHDAPMHLFVVREDLTEFQHVHPDFNPETGEFSQALVFQKPGLYRIVADFVPMAAPDSTGAGRTTVASADLIVETNVFQSEPLIPRRQHESGDYTVELSTLPEIQAPSVATLTLSINYQGSPINNLETYLGTYGHLIIFSEHAEGIVHTHPVEASSTGVQIFDAVFQKAGSYKAFFQFEHAGRLITSDFVVDVQ
jgi:hypothetical protein